MSGEKPKHRLDKTFVRTIEIAGLRIGIFGDSYMQGTGGEEKDSLAYQIVKLLEERVGINYLRIHAKDGATTSEIATDLHHLLPASNPDEEGLVMAESDKFHIIIVNGGVNDQYRGLGLSGFFDGLNKKLYPTLERMLFPEGWIFRVDTNDWSKTPAGVSGAGYGYRTDPAIGYEAVRERISMDPTYNTSDGVSREIAAFNERDKIVASSKGVHFIETARQTAEYVHPGELDREKFVDHIHFTKDVHEMQAKIIVDQIIEALRAKGMMMPAPFDESILSGSFEMGADAGSFVDRYRAGRAAGGMAVAQAV
jgi:hypothetical protein